MRNTEIALASHAACSATSRCTLQVFDYSPRGAQPDAWFTTGSYAEELIAISGYGRSATDVVGEWASLFAQMRRALVSVRHDEASRQIARLKKMEDEGEGWDGYAARLPNLTTIHLASELLHQFADNALPIPVATMSPSGNAALFCSDKGVYLDLEVHDDNRVSWLIQLVSGPEIEDEEEYSGRGDRLRVVEILKHVRGAL